MVTNKHVIEDANVGSFVFILNDGKGDPQLGRGIEVPVLRFRDHFHGHPDPSVDIAVSPLNPLIDHRDEATGLVIGQSTYVAPIRSQHIPTQEYIDNLEAIEEIFFIGYPAGLYDAVNLTPITRRGITATPLQVDYDGESVFLIDAAVFPGSSGSPAFLASSAIRTDKSGNLVLIASRIVLLGVIAKYLSKPETGIVEWKPIPTEENEVVPTYTTSQALNLGVVYKSSTVLETIDDFIKTYGDGKQT